MIDWTRRVTQADREAQDKAARAQTFLNDTDWMLTWDRIVVWGKAPSQALIDEREEARETIRAYRAQIAAAPQEETAHEEA